MSFRYTAHQSHHRKGHGQCHEFTCEQNDTGHCRCCVSTGERMTQVGITSPSLNLFIIFHEKKPHQRLTLYQVLGKKMFSSLWNVFSDGHCMCFQGAVITPTMDHPMSMQPTNIVGPLTQQMNHLSLGTAGTVSGRVCFCVLGLEKVPRAVFTSIADKLLISHPLRVPARVSLHASSIPGNTHSHGKGGGAVAWPLDFRSPSLCDARLQARQVHLVKHSSFQKGALLPIGVRLYLMTICMGLLSCPQQLTSPIHCPSQVLHT